MRLYPSSPHLSPPNWGWSIQRKDILSNPQFVESSHLSWGGLEEENWKVKRIELYFAWFWYRRGVQRNAEAAGVKHMLNPLTIFTILAVALSLVAFVAAVLALRKRKFLGGTIGFLLGLLFLSWGILFGTIAVGLQGYRALVREEIAAVVKIQPKDPQEFTAHFRLVDGKEVSFRIAGDEIYVDAHILKWKPIVNFLGLHTAYELDRVAGRYTRLEDEQSKPRNVFHLSQEKPINLFRLRQKYALLKPLLDAEYGSGTFIAADKAGEFEIRVSTSGLLIRPSK
jgi:hypothetical protein